MKLSFGIAYDVLKLNLYLLSSSVIVLAASSKMTIAWARRPVSSAIPMTPNYRFSSRTELLPKRLFTIKFPIPPLLFGFSTRLICAVVH